METKRIPSRTLSLFSGCGGMSSGFQNAGFEIIAAVDNWKLALDVYRINFPNTKVFEFDLSLWEDKLELFNNFKSDIVIAGPPCQDFSHAGKRNEYLGRGSLSISFAALVTALRTEWFVMENVERIFRSNTLKIVYKIFKEAGYGLTQKILDASKCGVPQRRKRYFLIGELHGEDDALDYCLTKNLEKKPLSIKEYLGDEMDIEYYYRHPRNYSRRAIFSVHEPSPTVRGVNRPIPANYKIHPGDKALVTPSLRPLTTKERSYIQTFPKNFILEGSKTNLEQMIGNAVPVKLAEYVAKCIIEYLENPKETQQSLYDTKHL